MKKSIYLCGLMDGISLTQATQWRTQATERLAQAKIRTADPTRKVNRKFLKTKKPLMAFDYKEFEDSAKGIIQRDMNSIRHCHGLLCYLLYPKGLPASKGPAGSLMELFFASRVLNIPTFVVAHPDMAKRPWIAGHSTKIFSTLDEALSYIVQYKSRL